MKKVISILSLVASEKLRAEGIKIDELTKDQEEYLKSW